MKKGFVFLIFAGCMVGPDYQEPEICMPDQFVEMQECAESDDEALCQWWKQFNDPQLDALIEEATLANYDVRIAIENIMQARAQYRIQSGALWPEFDVNAVASRSRNSQNFLGTTNTLPLYQNFFQVGFDAIWELDFWGKFRRSKRAAEDLVQASEEDAESVMISVLSEVARNYVAIRALQQKIELTEEQIQNDSEEFELTQDLFQAGLTAEIELEKSQAVLESAQSALPLLETSLKQTIYALAILVGRQPEEMVQEFNESAPIPIGLNRVPVGLPSDLLRRRPDVRSAERQLAAATEEIGVAVADLFPHISLTGTNFSGSPEAGSGYGLQSDQLRNLFQKLSQFWSIGSALRWNVWDFGRTRGNIDLKKALQRQALLTYEKTVLTSLQDVEGALVAYFEEQKRRLFLASQVSSYERNLQLVEDLQKAGLADWQQVLSARKTLLDSQNSLTDSEQSLTSDLIALYKALGGNWQCSYMP